MNANNSELPIEVVDEIKRWMGSAENILYFWEQDGTYFVVQQFDLLYFLRLFKLDGEYILSQDHECEVGTGCIQTA